jgi:YD repeat-containing protein
LGDNYIYLVNVIDNNGDSLAISLDTAPDGMVLESNARIRWTPGPNQLGDNLVRILADDGRGEATIQEFTVNVVSQPVNLPPEITSRPPTAALVDEIYRTDLDAVDPNSDSIIWQLLEAPQGMSLDPISGELNWTPSDSDIGDHTVSVEALDALFASSQLTYNLRVRAVNSPPVLQSTPPTEAAVGSTYFYQAIAEDVDQDALTFALPTAPAGMSINPASGRVQWTPETGQEGGHDVEISVSDALGATVIQQYTIQVASGQPNQPPTIVSNPAFSASVGDLYTYDVDAEDPDGDTLTYSLLTSPAGMTIDPQSGLIQWTPTSGDLGVEAVEVLASDPSGAGSLQGYPLTILASNNAPTITSTPPTTLAAGETFRYDVLATDADGEFLTYELVDGPEGMILDGLGRMFWVPTADQIGDSDVEVRVSDPRGGAATQSFTLTVETDTQAPQVAIQLSDNPVDVGSTIDIRVTAIDNVGVENLLLTVGGTAVPLDENGVARLTMDQVGSFAAVATATDAAGNSADRQLDIFVSDPNDVEGPVLAITSPADGGTVTAITDIIGTVNDDTLVSYRILLGDFATRNFREIASGTENVNDGVLGQIDPTLLVNDTYILRLEAIDAGGNRTALEQTVNLDGALKLGEFQLGFVDMTIPLANLPINITRTYDSLRSDRQGDFGFGWRLDYRDADLRTSLPSSGLEDAGIYTPFRDGTKVYLTLPGGERQGFTFTPSIQSLPGFGASLVLATPQFTPDPGVTSRLSVRGGKLIVNEFGELQAGGGVPWNPASPDFGGGYTLTTADGLRYFVDGDTGLLQSATHPNGEQLTFSDSGIASSLGTEVQFLRDAQGRIVSIVDPEGNAIEYSYDTAGDLVSVIDREKNETRMVYSDDRAHYLAK